MYEINKCKGIKNILYPYGLYFNDEINLFYPDRLDLNKISLCKKYQFNIDNPCKRPCKRRCEEPCCKPKCMPCVPVFYPAFLKEDFNPNYRYIERKNCCSKLKCRDRCCCRENKIFYPSQYNFHETTHENKNNAFIQHNISAFSNYPKN